MNNLKQRGQVTLGLTAMLLTLTTPCRAEIPAILDKLYGINVPVVPAGGRFPEIKRYLYSPALGAYTIGPDDNLKGMTPAEIRQAQSFMPKADPTFQGTAIPYTSGTILPNDINGNLMKEGINGAAPEAFKHPVRVAPWYTVEDEKVCSADFQKAWPLTANIIPPEVEVYGVQLPNQKLSADTLVIGSLKRKFPVVVPSAYGQILLKNSAKALVCRSAGSLRVFNLTGGKDSVLVRFPSGEVLSIGPGSELVATRSQERIDAPPTDGIARRGVSPLLTMDDVLVRVNEFSPQSLLKATGLHHCLSSVENTADKRFSTSILKTAAVLAMIKGSGGYAQPQAQLAERTSTVSGGNYLTKPETKTPHGLEPDIVPTSVSSSQDEEIPSPPKANALRRCSAVLLKWRNSANTLHAGKPKAPADDL